MTIIWGGAGGRINGITIHFNGKRQFEIQVWLWKKFNSYLEAPSFHIFEQIQTSLTSNCAAGQDILGNYFSAVAKFPKFSLFPILHKVQIMNAYGYIVHFSTDSNHYNSLFGSFSQFFITFKNSQMLYIYLFLPHLLTNSNHFYLKPFRSFPHFLLFHQARFQHQCGHLTYLLPPSTHNFHTNCSLELLLLLLSVDMWWRCCAGF